MTYPNFLLPEAPLGVVGHGIFVEKIIGIWDTEGKTYRNTGYLKKKYGDIQGIKLLRGYGIFREKIRLRVVSNFGDGNCGAGEIHTRVRVKI